MTNSPSAQRPDMRLMEVVLKTTEFERLIEWYTSFIQREPFLVREPDPEPQTVGGQERASGVRLAFFMVHDEVPFMQLFGVFGVPVVEGAPPQAASAGLHHFQFRMETLEGLVEQYERLRELGVTPHRTANHGISTSLYYRDPDGNVVEVSCANFATVEDQDAFLESEGFRRNPSGAELVAEDFVAQYRQGRDVRSLIALPG